MSAASLYPVHPEAVARTFTDEATYKTMYQQSVVNPDGFWREQAQRIDWIKPFEKVKQTSFDDHHVASSTSRSASSPTPCAGRTCTAAT